jgi:hypothetical protein
LNKALTFSEFVQNAEEEKLAMEGQYKKMRKFVRNSVLGSSGSKDSPVDQTAAAVLSALSIDALAPTPTPATPPPPSPAIPALPLETPRERTTSSSGKELLESPAHSHGPSAEENAVHNTSRSSIKERPEPIKLPSPRPKSTENDSGNGGSSAVSEAAAGGGAQSALMAAIMNRAKLKKVEND